MNNTFAITIGREFGSEGCEIGSLLAQKLNVPYYDRDLVLLSAKETGLDIGEIEKLDEHLLEKELNFFNKLGYGTSSNYLLDQVIEAQTRVIRDLATKESCVIAGRCGDFILKEYKYLFNIFIFAPMDYRIKHIMEMYEVPEKSAERMIKQIDRQRHNYYKYVTGRNRGDRTGKHILIDSSVLGVEGTVNLLYDMAIKGFPFAVC